MAVDNIARALGGKAQSYSTHPPRIGENQNWEVWNGSAYVDSGKSSKGNSIVSIEKTGTSGNVDTYTITLSDDSTFTFTVTNGSVTSVNERTGDVTGLAEQEEVDEIQSKIINTLYVNEDGYLCVREVEE